MIVNIVTLMFLLQYMCACPPHEYTARKENLFIILAHHGTFIVITQYGSQQAQQLPITTCRLASQHLPAQLEYQHLARLATMSLRQIQQYSCRSSTSSAIAKVLPTVKQHVYHKVRIWGQMRAYATAFWLIDSDHHGHLSKSTSPASEKNSHPRDHNTHTVTRECNNQACGYVHVAGGILKVLDLRCCQL